MTEDKARRAMMDAAKLAEDLRLEQEHTTRADGERRAMEAQVKDLQVRQFLYPIWTDESSLFIQLMRAASFQS